MDDFFNFLLIVATVVVFVSKLFKKETDKATEADIDVDVPDEDTPLPRTVTPTSRHTAVPPSRPSGKTSRPSGKTSRKAPSSTPSYDHRSPQEEPEADSEFAIRSAEEARRAIVWSEILRRIEN